MVLAVVYGVEAWGGTISLGAWNEIHKIQKDMKICKVSNENVVEDEYHVLIACSSVR